MRLHALLLSALALAVLASGCGSGTKSAANTTATTVTAAATSTTAPTTTAPATTPSFATTGDCAKLTALGAEIAKTIQPGSDPESLVTSERAALQRMANAVPSEIRADFQTFVDAFDAYGQAIVKAGLKAGTQPSATQLAELAAAAKAFSTPKLQQAERHLAAWAQRNCGVGTTTTG